MVASTQRGPLRCAGGTRTGRCPRSPRGCRAAAGRPWMRSSSETKLSRLCPMVRRASKPVVCPQARLRKVTCPPVSVWNRISLTDFDHVAVHRTALPQHLLGRQPPGDVAHHVKHGRLAVEVDAHAGGFGVDWLAVEALVAQQRRQNAWLRSANSSSRAASRARSSGGPARASRRHRGRASSLAPKSRRLASLVR